MKKKYKVRFTSFSKHQLKKLDKNIGNLIIAYLLKNIEGSENPRLKGKPLKGDYKDKWRYRIGDYRITCKIEDNIVLVLVLNVGHRKEVYK